MAGIDLKVNGKEYFFTANGCEINVCEWVNSDLHDVYNKHWLMATPYEAITMVCSELWDKPELGEYIATKLGYPILTADDAECIVCGEYSFYEEMIPDGEWDYVHESCQDRLAEFRKLEAVSNGNV